MALSTTSPDVLSVDLGTSTTTAVVRDSGGDTATVEFDGEPLLPSGVCAVSGGRLATGRDACDLADTHPESFEPAPKRRIGAEPVSLGYRDYTADELVAAVLGRVVDEAHRQTGRRPGRLVLTFPGGWGTERRMVLVEAARRLGVTEPMLLPEPIAAARFVNSVYPRAVPVGRTTVVYDLGAGTFDATVLRRTPHGFTQLASEDLPDTGGDEIDAAIVAHLEAASESAADDAGAAGAGVWRRLAAPVTAADRHATKLLWDRVRAAKERLSRDTSATVRLPVLERAVPLTRHQVEAIARPILDRTVTATRAALMAAGPPATRLAAVFLIGGSSRIPLIAQLIALGFGVTPVLVDQPDLVVARGAALPGSRPVPLPRSPLEKANPERGIAGPSNRPWISRLTRAVTRPNGERRDDGPRGTNRP